MSKVKIERVDRLNMKHEEVVYIDLKPGQGFEFVERGLAKGLRIRTHRGHVDPSDGTTQEEGSYRNYITTPVDVEIKWAYRDGGDQ